MSNVTGLVFKSHFRLNILIFKCNVILSLLFGTSQSEKPRQRQTALLQMGARPQVQQRKNPVRTNGRPSVQMRTRPKVYKCGTVRRASTATNGPKTARPSSSGATTDGRIPECYN